MILWVLEKPRKHERSMAGLLQGDFAVRAFASVRNFLKLGALSAAVPQAIVIHADDFLDDLDNLEKLIGIHWPKAEIVVVGDAAGDGLDRAVHVPDDQYPELPFIMQRLLHVADEGDPSHIELGDLRLDLEANRLQVLPHGEWQHLTLKEAQILRHLIRFQDRYLSHEDLCNEIWKDVKVSPKSVSSHISRLRRSLAPSHYAIESIYGGGYRLVHQASEG